MNDALKASQGPARLEAARFIVLSFGYLAIFVALPVGALFGVFDRGQEFAWEVAVSPDKTQTAIGVDYAAGGAISPTFWTNVRIAGGVIRRDDPELGSEGEYLLWKQEGFYGVGWSGPDRLYVEGDFK